MSLCDHKKLTGISQNLYGDHHQNLTVPCLTFALLEFSAFGERLNAQINTRISAHLNSSNEHLCEVIDEIVLQPRQ
jgi:hypothetical protein